MTTIEETVRAIDAAARSSGFQCCPVSWEDAQRGTVDGGLSCWGSNISDVRLWERSGKLIYTLRSNNFNERLGYVSSNDVAVVTGNHVAGGAPPTACTLKSYLQGFNDYASYAGVNGSGSLYDPTVDELFTIRFQTVFLPIVDKGTVEFCTEVYNYNTVANDDPRNQLLLVTPQGTSIQQDGAGAQRVYFHSVDPHEATHRYWLEAERSSHKVGGAQVETTEEAQAAASRGKATSIHIGTRAMGTRFNVQMLVQIPLKQTDPVAGTPCEGSEVDFYCKSPGDAECFECGASNFSEGGSERCASDFSSDCLEMELRSAPRSAPRSARCVEGVSNAARVSRGTEVDVWGGVANSTPERDNKQHGTITVTMYYTVAGGVPTVADVTAAIADLNALYASCPSDKRLAQCSEVTKELTVNDMLGIHAKVATQPYQPNQ